MVAVALLAAVIGIVFYGGDLLRGLEAQSVDARFSVRGTESMPGEIVIVGIDNRSLAEMPNTPWPFPRSREAKAIETLTEDGVRAIAVDIQFSRHTILRQDEALIAAITAAPALVLSTTETNRRGESRIFLREKALREIGVRAADTIVPVESGGTRKMYYEHDGLDSFGVATAEAMTGRRISAEGFEDGKAWIDYRGPPGTFRNVSFSRVLRGEVPPSIFFGKTVVIGATAPVLEDQHSTSTSGDGKMSGPELQANAIWTAAHGVPLASSATVVDLILIVALAAAAAAATVWLKSGPALGAALVLALAYLLTTQLAFDAGSVLPVAYPLLALAVAALGALAVNHLITGFERARLHDVFARFVPEPVVADALDRVDEDGVHFAGVRRECTVLLAGLRGFTSFAEELESDRAIEVLNRYLEEMSAAILERGGTLLAYAGDGIMALFGAPVEQEDHADRALAAAREMQQVRLPRLNEWLAGHGLDDGFEIGIGIDSGTVMSGQVGSERRIEYAAIGEATDTAARLKSMTAASGDSVFVTDSTRIAMRRADVELQLLGEREVPGRPDTITVWTLA